MTNQIMNAVIQTNQLEVGRVGTEKVIPNSDIARLMYYLYCVCKVIDYTNDSSIQRYISYEYYYLLTSAEQKALIDLCRSITPDMLRNKVFFQIDALCVNCLNEFYEINQVQNRIFAVNSIIIAGQARRVNKIMIYKQAWLQIYYYSPIQRLTSISTTIIPRQTIIVRPQINSIQYVPVQSSKSSKCPWICCIVICIILFFVVPAIIGIVFSIINSKK